MKMPQQVTWKFDIPHQLRGVLQWVWQEIAQYVNGPLQPQYFEMDTVGLTVFPNIEAEQLVVLKDTGSGMFYLLYRDQNGNFHTAVMS